MRSYTLLLACTLMVLPALPQKQRRTTQPPVQSPLSFELVVKMAKTLPERKTLDYLNSRGIDFTPTNEQVQQLRDIKAPKKIIDFLEARVPPPAPLPPPPPPPPKEGFLTISCNPVDCDVTVEGKKAGSTKNGVLEGLRFKEGTVLVGAAREGYDVDPPGIKETIVPEQTKVVTFRLKPSKATLERAAVSLFETMLTTLGGDAGLTNMMTARWTGVLSVYGSNGQAVLWDTTALLRYPNQARFSVSRANTKYEAVRTEAGFDWNKKVSGPAIADLEDALRTVREFQLPAVITRIRAAKPRFMVETLDVPAGAEATIRADSSPDSWIITLDPEKRPKEIRIESDLASGTRLIYGMYTMAGKAIAPQRLQVIFPSGQRKGVDARWDRIETAAAVKDTDFSLKKAYRLSGGK